jgi:fatty-acyl-CoA synthase
MASLTLAAALDEAAAAGPAIAVDFPSEATSVSLRELADLSVAVGAGLTAAGMGVRSGDRVGVFSHNAPDFLAALFGIVRIGAAACPLPLPGGGGDLAGYAARVSRICSSAGVRVVVCSDRTARLAGRFAAALPGLTFVAASALAATGSAGAGPVGTGSVGTGERAVPAAPAGDVDPNLPAIVQFTSGSTSMPKGVTLSHTQALAGVAAITAGMRLGPADVAGLWLPLFHDMGLFGTLTALLRPAPVSVWAPTAFVRDPARWLDEFAARGCTVSAGPNFGYELLIEAVPAERAASLDLSRWRLALNGGEPVPVDTVERFAARFGPAGFDARAMFPAYGMAEATLAVTFPPLDRAPVVIWVDRIRLADDAVAKDVARTDPRARGLVSAGAPVLGLRVRIADPASGRALPDDQVGEIEIAGASVTSGYLSDQAAAGEPGDAFTPDGWLPTGDLGFTRSGELFVTGRRKDMIIVRGVNHYPQDVEAAAQDVTGVYRRRCVAVADRSEAGAEMIVLLAETALDTPAERDQLAAELRDRVAGVLGLSELAVRLVPPSALPRTSSGKFQRAAAGALARNSL